MIGFPTTTRSQTSARLMPAASLSSPIRLSMADRTAVVNSAVPPGFNMA